MGIVTAKDLRYDYLKYTEDEEHPEKTRAIDGITFDVAAGDFIAILGQNGSGKSTLARHINALLLPTGGTIWIDGKDTKTEPEPWKIRAKAGMVFQNPDNQIIGTSVEEDTGFGPENLGLPREEIWERVSFALQKTGMESFRTVSPNRLSGGQKQRVAIAGIVAMRPECIVLDEPTAMLDPSGRREVIEVLHELNRRENVTIILITHYMEEVIGADRIYVMGQGRIRAEGTPKEIFSQIPLLRSLHLDVPQVTLLSEMLREEGLPLSEGILTAEEFTKEVSRCADPEKVKAASRQMLPEPETSGKTGGSLPANDREAVLSLQHVNYTYYAGTVYETKALDDLDMTVHKGEFLAVIGHTGSGKSTLIQLFNGLLKPDSGQVLFHGEDIFAEKYNRKNLRTSVGLVFQYPENQLFEEDVLRDVCFGPKNQKCSQEEAEERAREALRGVGIGEKYFSQSPFDLSGGQKRRVAIAGVLAMRPEVLILDEPTAGLDPKGRDAILGEAEKLQKEKGITVILVSHSMEDVARYAERIVVIDKGRILISGTPEEVFSREDMLEKAGLGVPQVTTLIKKLRDEGLPLPAGVTTVERAKEEILKICSER